MQIQKFTGHAIEPHPEMRYEEFAGTERSPTLSLNQYKIRAKLQRALKHDDRVGNASLLIDVSGSEVVLRGTVPSSVVRMAAEYDARAVRGVGRVDNQIKVKSPDRNPLPAKSVLRQAAKRAIRSQADLSSCNIGIDADHGRLILTGSVRRNDQEQRACALGFLLPGVLEVINQIAIVPGARKRDREIGAEINRRFYESIWIDVNTMSVTVHEGMVHLDGQVEQPDDLSEAENLARTVEGVRRVDHDIVVLQED